MKITAITKLKWGELHLALQKAGISQSEFSKKLGISATTLSCYSLLKIRPSSEMMDRIQVIFGELGVFFDVDSWPEGFKTFRKAVYIEETRKVDIAGYLEMQESKSPLDYLIEMEEADLEPFDASILNDREKDCLKLKFIEGKTLAEVGKQYRVEGETIGCIINKGLIKLRRRSWTNNRNSDNGNVMIPVASYPKDI
jgi:transcriptional regulator with XRE-family HTH domain